jgi:hypothetical protein
VQHVQQVGRAELGRSTGCGNLLRESQKLRPFASGDLRHARVIVEESIQKPVGQKSKVKSQIVSWQHLPFAF